MTARLVILAGDPADDPCQYVYGTLERCSIHRSDHGIFTHPFTGPREVTAEDLWLAANAVGLVPEPRPDTHRWGDKMLAALTAPPEDAAR